MTLEVKPLDHEVDMTDLEVKVRQINMDGLLWGAGKCFHLKTI